MYIKEVANLASSFVPTYTPSYSNANFALLGLALENMLGATIEDIFDKSIAKPLGLRSTTMGNPLQITNDSVIPGGGLVRSGWWDALGPLNSGAGGFSTTNDLAAVGRSILNSTLISQATTRRWLSTTTFVDQTEQAAGRGWEIFRVRTNGHSADLYTKSGNWGVYNSVFVLLPAYDFGFSILSASGSARAAVVDALTNDIINTLLPALEAVTKRQASANYAGRFSSPDEKANTSITVITDVSLGLRVTEYIVSGVDLLASVFSLFGSDVEFRLIPNQLYDSRTRVGFSAVYQGPSEIPPKEEFYWSCPSWLDVDDYTYANVPLGLMAFDVGIGGKAASVRLVALREALLRKSDVEYASNA